MPQVPQRPAAIFLDSPLDPHDEPPPRNTGYQAGKDHFNR
jgi:hypothetical protein